MGAQPAFVAGSQARQRSVTTDGSGSTSTHCPCLPSVQSAGAVHGASAAQLPDAAQSGDAPPLAVAHSASLWHARHVSASQIGAVGTVQPPVALQSTHFSVATSHLSFVPEQPPSSTQSTHVAVAGSHWFDTGSVQPASVAGSHAAHWPCFCPEVAHVEGPPLAAQRVFGDDTPAALQATHCPPSQSGAAAEVHSASVRHSAHVPGLPRQNRVVPVPEHAAVVPHAH